MHQQSISCATRLFSVLTNYLQSNTRVISRKDLPSLLLGAAWQLQTQRAAKAQRFERSEDDPKKQTEATSCGSEPWSPKKRRGTRRSPQASLLAFEEASSRYRRNSKKDFDDTKWLCQELFDTLMNAKSMLRACVRLHRKLRGVVLQKSPHGSRFSRRREMQQTTGGATKKPRRKPVMFTQVPHTAS